MQTTKLAKSILNYLPILAVMAAVVLGMVMAKDPDQPSLNSQAINTTPLLMLPGADSPCISPLIYTSLPAKCKTADGTFIQVDEMSSNVFTVPKVK